MADEKSVQDWLIDEGMLKERITDEQANFHYTIAYPNDNIMDLIQPKGKNDMIVIGCATHVSPEHTEMIRNLSMDKKIELIWKFKYIINGFLLDFQVEHPDNILQLFVITSTIYADGLSKNALIGEIKKIFKVKLQCLLEMDRILGQTVSSTPSKPDDHAMFQ